MKPPDASVCPVRFVSLAADEAWAMDEAIEGPLCNCYVHRSLKWVANAKGGNLTRHELGGKFLFKNRYFSSGF